MNHIYRTLWSVATQSWQAVPEIAKSAGKKSKSSAGGVLASVALGIGLSGGANAQSPPAVNQLPTGGNVARGTATISQTATAQAAAMTVNQTSQRAVINWNTFNVGSNASVNFVQPNAQAVTLNRVNDSNPSQIFGRISANGQVFLTNANGVYFSPTSSVDVGALTATTHSITDDNFMSGNYVFNRNGATGKIINEGNITAALGGYVALLAPEVQNAGVVVAHAGTVAMAAGETITLNFDGVGGLAGITTTPSAIASLIENKLAVQAPDGQIILSAVALNKLQVGLIKNSGILEANSLVNKGGNIYLEGDSITLESNSKIEVKGHLGGGTVLVGGDWQGSGTLRQATKVTMEAGATIDASATDNGDGGKVVLWSDVHNADSVTQVSGSIKAEAGSNGGNGGQVETSGHTLQLGGQVVVNTQAAGQGSNGKWLLDPANIDINSAGTEAGSTFNSGSRTFAPNSGVAASIINPSTIQSALASGNVTITTTNTGATGGVTGNITVTSNLAWTSGNQFTLIAAGGISGAGNITTGTAASNLTFNQNGSSTYSGAIGGAGSVTKLGTGTLTLSGLNAFTGNVNIDAGALRLGHNMALGEGTTGRVTVASGAALDLYGFSLAPENAKPLTISGTSATWGGALVNNASNSISIYPGLLTLGAHATISSGSSSSVISLTNQSAITGASHNLTLRGSGQGHIASIIGSDVGTLTISGGAWALSGANTYTGVTTVSAGKLKAGSPTAFSTGAIIVSSGATLDLNGQTMTSNGGLTISGAGDNGALTNGNSATATYSGLVSLGANATIGAYAGSIILTNTGTITGNGFNLTLTHGGTESRIDSIIGTGAGTLIKHNPGTWTLNAANTYSGGTTINSGALKLGNASALGSGSIAVIAGELDINGKSVSGQPALSIQGSGYLNGGALTNSNAVEATFDGPVTLTANASISGNVHLTSSTAISGAFMLTLGGAVGGRISSPISITPVGNSLIKTGVSTWTVDVPTTYSGATIVQDGTLVAGVDNAFGAATPNGGDAIQIGAVLGTTKSMPTLSLGRYNLTTAGQVYIPFGGGAITSTTGVLVSTNTVSTGILSNADGSMYPSIISAIIGGTAGVKKAGGMGILILTGANTYTGPTVVVSGTLQLGDGGTTGSLNSASSIDVSNGSLTSGTLAYNLSTGASPTNSISNTGTISNLAYGSTLNLSGATLTGNGTYVASVNESAATPTVASIVFRASPSLNGTTLNVLTSGFQPLFSPQTVISWTGTATGAPTLKLNGVVVTSGQNAVGGILTKNSNNISIGPGAMWSFTNAGTTNYFNSASDATNTVLTGTSSIVVPPGVSVTESGALSGSAGLTIMGGGTLTLDGNNSNSGTITVSAGTLRAGSGSAYGTGAITISSGAALDLNGQTLSTAGALTLNGTGINSGGALMNSSGAASYGGLLTLGSASSIVGDSGSIALSNTGNLTGSYGLTLGGAAGGSIASSIATGTLTKQNSGTWTLNGSNTYSGGTTVSAGVLKAGNSRAFSTGVITVASGGALDLNGQNMTSTGTLTLNGTGISNGGSLMNSSTTGAIYSGAVTLGSNSLISGGSGTLALTSNTLTGGNFSLTLGGASGGSLASSLGTTLYSLTKQDSGTWTLNNASNSAYVGGITINGGTLAAGAATSAFGASTNAILINGGTLALGTYAETVGTVTIGANGGAITATTGVLTGTSYTINNAGPAVATISASLAGGGALTKTGTGLATLSGSNTYIGSTILNGGTLALGSDGALGTVSVLSFGGGTLQYSGSSTTDYSSRFSSVSGQAYSIDTNGQTVTFASNLTSSGGTLTKLGSGTLVLNGTNTYTGAVTIDAGALRAANNTALGASSGVAVASSATLEIGGSSNLTIGAIPLTVADGGTIHNVAGHNTYAGNMTLSGNATITIDTGTSLNFTASTPAINVLAGKRLTLNTNGNLTFGQALTGGDVNASYVKSGAGSLYLPSTGNTLQAAAGVNSILSGGINVVPLNNNEVAALIGSQLAALTASQIASFSTTQLQVFSWQQIAALSPSEFAALSPAQLASLSAAQLQGLSAAQMSFMTPAQLGGLTPSQFAGLNNAQLQAMSAAQVRAISIAQLSLLSPAQIALLTGNAATPLSLQQIMALTPAQLGGMSTVQVASLTAAEVSSLSNAQLNALSLDQLAAISPASLAALSSEQIMALSLMQVASLTPDQLSSLSPTQIASLSAEEIASFDAQQLAAIGIFPSMDESDAETVVTAKFTAPAPAAQEVSKPTTPSLEVTTVATEISCTNAASANSIQTGVLSITVLSNTSANIQTAGVAFEQDASCVSLRITSAPPVLPMTPKLVFKDKMTTFMVAQTNGQLVEFQGSLINKQLVIVAPSSAAKQIARADMNMVLAAAITNLGAENRVVLANLDGVVIDLR